MADLSKSGTDGTQVAQALVEPIGKVETVKGTVIVKNADGAETPLQSGDPIFQGDELRTGPEGAVGIVFIDDSTFSLAEDARMVIDELVYDPSTQEGSLKANLVQGVFSFISGEIAKTDPEAMTIATPMATIGIRGTTGAINLPAGESLTVVLTSDAGGTVGEITVFNDAGVQILNTPYQATQVAGLGLPPAGTFTMSVEQFNSSFGSAVAFLPPSPGAGDQGNDGDQDGEATGDGAADGTAGDGEGEGEGDAAGDGEGDGGDAEGEGEGEEQLAEAEGDPEAEGEGEGEGDGDAEGDGTGDDTGGDAPVAASPSPTTTGETDGPDAGDGGDGGEDGDTTPTPTPPTPTPTPTPTLTLPPTPPPTLATTPTTTTSTTGTGTPTGGDDDEDTPQANSAPVALNGTGELDEDTSYTDKLSATDPDGNPIASYGVASGPAHGTVTISSDGSYTYTPVKDYYGTDSFTFTATDSQGATSSPATISLTINDVAENSPPSAFGDSASFDEDTSYTGSFLAADIEGNPVTFAVETGPANGTVVVNGDGTYTYTPDADYFGTDSFTFTATDSEGGSSSPATIALTINNTADDPIAVDGSATLNENGTYNGTLSGSDPDGTAVTYAQYLGPMYGSVTINSDGTYSYTPIADYYGLDSFTYTVTDGDGAVSNVATVTLDINGVPTTYDGSATLDEDTPYSGTLMASDVEGDPMTFAVATGPAHGTVMIDVSTGDYTYTPYADYNGTDSFTFTVTDARGAVSNTATIDLTINDVPLAATSGDDVLVGDATNDALVMAQSGTTVPSGTLGGTDSFDGGDGVDSLTLGNLNQVTGYFDAVNFTAHLWGWADVGDANPDDPYQLYSADAAAQATVTFSNLEEIYFESYDGTTDAHYPTNFSLGDPFVGMLVAGGTGADWINWDGSNEAGWFATADGTVIFGGDGDDVIYGSDGDDDIYGGADNDTLYGGDGYNSLSGGAGNDTIYAEGYFDNVISGDDGDDTIIISGGTAYHDVDGGLGTDSLALSAGSDMVVVYDVETITDSGGDDSVGAMTLFTTGSSVDLGSGTDALALAEGVNTLTISNVETVTGTMGNDTLNLESTISGTSIDLGAGTDSLVLANGGNSVTVSSTESITGGTGDDGVTVATLFTTGSSVDLGGGTNDNLYLAGGSNTLSISGVEYIYTTGGDDTLILESAITGVSFDFQTGTDSLVLADAANSLMVHRAESIVGGTGNDDVTFGAAADGGTVDLGAGTDSLALSSGSNTVYVSNIETITDSGGDDAVTAATLFTSGSSVDLGSGTDALSLATGTNTLTISNVESVSGTMGDDTLILEGALTGATMDLGTGIDSLTLADATNQLTVSRAETITGGTGDDTVTLGSNASGISVDLGTGTDSLILSGGTNTVSISGAETITGGSGVDTLTIDGTEATSVTVDAGSGNDSVTIAATNSQNILLDGGSGSDSFVLDGSGTHTVSYTASTISEAMADSISGFAAGSGGDILDLTASGTGTTFDVVTDPNWDYLTINPAGVILFTQDMTGTPLSATDVAAYMPSFNSNGTSNVVLVVGDGSTTAAYWWEDTSGNSHVDADELTAIAALNGVDQAALDSSNFSLPV